MRSFRSHVDDTHGDGTGLQAIVILSNRGRDQPVGFPASPCLIQKHSTV